MLLLGNNMDQLFFCVCEYNKYIVCDEYLFSIKIEFIQSHYISRLQGLLS